MRSAIILAVALAACEPSQNGSTQTKAPNKQTQGVEVCNPVRVGPSGGPAVRCGNSPIGIDIWSGSPVVIP